MFHATKITVATDEWLWHRRMGDSSVEINCTPMEMSDQPVVSVTETNSDQSGQAGLDRAIAIDCGVPEAEQGANLMTQQTNLSQSNLAQVNSSDADADQIASDEDSFAPPAQAEIPAELVRLLEYQFEGKTFGVNGFGPAFKQAILRQVAAVKNVLESEAKEAGGNATMFSVEQINSLIEMCDCSGAPEKSSPYVQPLLIAIVREDIGRAYLRGLQIRGQMLGTSYAMLTAPPPEPQAVADVAVDTAASLT